MIIRVLWTTCQLFSLMARDIEISAELAMGSLEGLW